MRGVLMHVLILKLKCQFVIALLLILAAKLLLAIALVIHLRSLLLSLTPARNTTCSLSAALRDKCPPSSACMQYPSWCSSSTVPSHQIAAGQRSDHTSASPAPEPDACKECHMCFPAVLGETS